MEAHNSETINMKRISVILLICYFVLSIGFYFLADEKLLYCESAGEVILPNAETVATDLVAGTTVEQFFAVNINKLESISIQMGSYSRENYGTLTMELYSLEDNHILACEKYDVSLVTEGSLLTMVTEHVDKDLYGVPLKLKIYSDSSENEAVVPLMNISGNDGKNLLQSNGETLPGTLCMSVTGKDYLWIGQYYWIIVLAIAVLLSGYLIFVNYKESHSKKTFLGKLFFTINKYSFLIKQLVGRDFKTKYKRSVLGVFWSFLNPLLTMSVQYLVFSNLFRFDIPYYPVYLLCGIIMFNYFSEACGMALSSIVGNAGLITKVYMPKYIYPLTRIMSSLVNLVISMIPLFIVSMISGLFPTKAYLLIPYVLLCIAIFCLGLGMLLAAAMVFFRDIEFLWGVITTIWMYLTPTFYPASILPANIAWVLELNPLYYFITFLRCCIIEGVSPEPLLYLQSAVIAVGMFICGSVIFKKTQDKFALYI